MRYLDRMIGRRHADGHEVIGLNRSTLRLCRLAAGLTCKQVDGRLEHLDGIRSRERGLRRVTVLEARELLRLYKQAITVVYLPARWRLRWLAVCGRATIVGRCLSRR